MWLQHTYSTGPIQTGLLKLLLVTDVSSLKWLQLHVSHTLEQKLHPSVGTGPSWEHEATKPQENPDPSRCTQATILPFQLEGNSFQLKTFP